MATIPRWKPHVNRTLIDHPAMAQVLSATTVERYAREASHRWRDSFWSPSITVITFLLQILDGAKTLRAAVTLLLTQLAGRGENHLPSADPSAYCQARRRLPFDVLAHLLRDVADRIRPLISQNTAWHGRRVWIVDGSSASMPDVAELQAAFPQPSGQESGCGFPVAQFVALFCWSTGAIVDLAIDSLVPHELPLFRTLWSHFAPGDIVLADRAYCTYVDMARLLQCDVDTVCRLHQRRPADFRAGRRLGPDDRLFIWERPRQWLPSFGIDRDAFERLPETLPVRLVRVTKSARGFRAKTLVVATTLLDPVQMPAHEIRQLYRDRWTAELNLRSLKTHLGMDALRGPSVDVVRKEIVTHLLVYNMIRLLMWHAARAHGRDLQRLSFTGTLHRFRAAFPVLLFCARRLAAADLLAFVFVWTARDAVPARPNRYEPRRVKRRPKQYSRLVKPRRWYHRHGDNAGR